MNALGPHADFIVAAYAIAATVLLALIVWIVADHRAQKQKLAALDAQGVKRRSAKAR